MRRKVLPCFSSLSVLLARDGPRPGMSPSPGRGRQLRHLPAGPAKLLRATSACYQQCCGNRCIEPQIALPPPPCPGRQLR